MDFDESSRRWELGDFEFEEPDSLRGARERADTLREHIKDIEFQLGHPNRTERRRGREKRMKGKRYQKWRKNARKALRLKHQELRALKDWIHGRQRAIEAGEIDVDPRSCEDLVKLAYSLLRSCRERHGVQFEDEDLSGFNVVRDYALGTS